jgi:hypothetical protein
VRWHIYLFNHLLARNETPDECAFTPGPRNERYPPPGTTPRNPQTLPRGRSAGQNRSLAWFIQTWLVHYRKDDSTNFQKRLWETGADLSMNRISSRSVVYLIGVDGKFFLVKGTRRVAGRFLQYASSFVSPRLRIQSRQPGFNPNEERQPWTSSYNPIENRGSGSSHEILSCVRSR